MTSRNKLRHPCLDVITVHGIGHTIFIEKLG